jgi:arylsulfatase A-like enzyme/Flp pilus assembly protein TadD
VTAGCSSPQPPEAPPAARHLLLITIDTLRADRLGCYGNTQVATPAIDRLAREGTLAVNATAHVPLTRPSHLSMFTGRYPAALGIRDNISAPFAAPDVPTLADVLQKAGFRTAAFVSSIVLSRQSGLNRGFDTYEDQFSGDRPEQMFLNTIQKRGGDTTREALDYLARAREADPSSSERLALWIHLYDPHDPYEPPEPYATRYAGRPYDGEVAWSDELVGRIRTALEQAGLFDSTLVVVTSDHGEGLGEHEEAAHGFFIYETTLRVPLVMRGPGLAAGTRLEPVVRLIDLFPTVLDLLGVAPPAGVTLEGRSVAAAMRGGTSEGDFPSYAESLVPLVHYGWSDLRSIRDGRWKYILAPRAELYDLSTDPGERTNLLDAQPARARALRAALESELRKEQSALAGDPGAAAVPPDLLEKLGALGYVSPGPRSTARAGGADPKDKVGEFKTINRLMREGLTFLHARDFAASRRRLSELHALGVDSFEVNFYLGRALAGAGRHREAVPHFQTATERLPGFGAAYLALADSLVALRDLAGATAALRRGQAAAPKEAALFEREGEVWRRRGNPREAIAAYERMLPLSPRDALARVRLGEFYRDLGDTARALTYLREAVALDASQASYWNALGMVLGGRGELADAEAAFREAVSRDGRNAQYLYNLGLSLERQGRPADASAIYRKVLTIDPAFRAAGERLRTPK